jgi:hypothetical protein
MAKLKTPIIVSDQLSETQNVEFIIEECKHERIKYRIPPIIKTTRDWYDNATYEYCKDCKKVLRVSK